MTIVEVYYRLIKAGRKNIEEIPTNIKANVQALLDKENVIEG